MSPPTRRSEPHDRLASHKTTAKKSGRQSTAAPKCHGWDDGTAARDEGWWTSVLEFVDNYAPKAVG